MAFVSVIIPCFNSEKFVSRAIESVLRQTHTAYEIILVDNASTDNTLAVLSGFAKSYPDMIKVFQEPKKGAPAARNKGLAEAKGEWLQFLDSDDELLHGKLAHQVEVAEATTADLIVGSCYKLKEGKSEEEKWIVPVITDNQWKALVKSRLGKTSSLLWRKAAVVAAGGWNEALTSSQEYDLLFRLLKNNIEIGYTKVPETILHIRENSIARSESSAKLIEILNNRVNLRIAVRDHLASKGELTKELKQTIDAYIRSKLLPYKKRVPKYVNDKLAEFGLQVSFGYKIRQAVSRFKKKTSAYIRDKFLARSPKTV